MTREQAAALRKPFPPEMIGKLPRVTCKRCSESDGRVCSEHRKVKCVECGNYITERHIHLDYCGHAATTDRLLAVDPEWSWEPMAYGPNGEPLVTNGGMWIKLTVAGVTRPGFGDGASVKEIIGDCLIAGTLIPTSRGMLPIERVRVGDLTLTRRGWRHVSDHWLSHPAAPTVTALLSDGSMLRGTPHHPVYVIANGWVHLERLRNGAMLLPCPDRQPPLAKQSYSKASRIAGTRDDDITSAGMAAPRWRSIERSMRRVTAQRRRDGTSIIVTAIAAITRLRTSSRSRRLHTRLSMLTTSAASTESVMSAGGSITLGLHDQTCAGAPTLARNEPDEHLESIESRDHVMYAEVRSQSSEKQPRAHVVASAPKRFATRGNAFASNADPRSRQGEHGPSSAPLYVVAVLADEPGEVWNLTVADQNEFFANGVLTHNSIRNAAMRFGVALDLWAKEDLGEPSVEHDTASPGDNGTPAADEPSAGSAKATRAQHAKLHATINELEKNAGDLVPDGFGSWEAYVKDYATRQYHVDSRADMTTQQMSDLIDKIEKKREALEVPFG